MVVTHAGNTGACGRVVCVDRPAVWPIVVVWDDGNIDVYGADSNKLREHREPREWWANIYEFSEQPALHFSKAYADEAAGSDRIECIRVREVIE
jgi:hypothetical protein